MKNYVGALFLIRFQYKLILYKFEKVRNSSDNEYFGKAQDKLQELHDKTMQYEEKYGHTKGGVPIDKQGELKQIASDKDHPHRLAAIIYMVDHGYGKPQASVDHSGGVTLLNLLNADGVEK